MQTITIPFNGDYLDLNQIPDLTNDIVDWHLQISSSPPVPPNLFTICIFYHNIPGKKELISSYILNGQNIRTNITNISNQTVKASFLLYFSNSQKVVKDDIDIIIKRPGEPINY